ncbi:MAG: YheC/YheD family protein [Limnochordia bacterium]|nr:YheC/YheD family protein [Limnochordia bacterium]
MYRKIGRALMMNTLQKVPAYSILLGDRRADLLFFDPRGIDWEKERVWGLLLKRGRWVKGYFAFPETIYNRCYPEPKDVLERLSTTIGSDQIFNHRTHFDKWEIFQILRKSAVGDYLPETYQYGEDDLAELLTRHRSLILKPRLSHGGAGVIKVTLLSPNVLILMSQAGWPVPLWDAGFFIPLLTDIAPPSRFIAQEYLESATQGSDKFDIRILMQKNGAGTWEVGGQLSRVGDASNLLTNHYHTILAPSELVSADLLSTLQSLSQVVAETLDGTFAVLGELGVDFLVDEEGKPWILEVNGKPDKSLFSQLHDEKMLRRVYLNPLDYQRHLLHW